MPFAAGDRVHIPRLGTGVVLEVRRGGRVVVEIKGRKTVVDEAQMEHAEPARAVRGGRRSESAETTAQPPGSATTIDLHGKTVEDAIAALDAFLNEALMAAHAEVRVIHGRSGGKIRDAVHKRLRALPPVKSFRLDPRNPGVTIVTL